MCKSIAAIVGLAAILSLGSLIAAQAGGGGTSAPSKYNNAGQNSRALAKHQLHDHGILFVVGEIVDAEALTWKPGSSGSATPLRFRIL